MNVSYKAQCCAYWHVFQKTRFEKTILKGFVFAVAQVVSDIDSGSEFCAKRVCVKYSCAQRTLSKKGFHNYLKSRLTAVIL